MSLPVAERNRSTAARSSRVGQKTSAQIFHPLWAINSLRALEKAGRLKLSRRAYDGFVAFATLTDNNTGLARCTHEKLGEAMHACEKTAWSASQELELLEIIRQDKTGRGGSRFVWANEFLHLRDATGELRSRDASLRVTPFSRSADALVALPKLKKPKKPKKAAKLKRAPKTPVEIKRAKLKASIPRTRISETNHAPAAGASAAPSSASSPTELELPQALAQLPGELEPAEVLSIMRAEHQDAVLHVHKAVRDGKKTSSLVPMSRAVLEWALFVGALAACADDTRASAVRRGVKIGMQIYTRLPGHKSKTYGDLNEECHPGMFLTKYLEQLKVLVHNHFIAVAGGSSSPARAAPADALEQRELERVKQRHTGVKIVPELEAMVNRRRQLVAGAGR